MSDAFDYHIVPDNSMGVSKGEHSFIKWSYFWQLFNQYSDWDLEYNNGDGWISCKDALTIIKEHPQYEPFSGIYDEDTSRYKITLDFTAPYTANYRLTFVVDVRVKEYIEKVGQYQYEINYKVGEHNGEDEIYTVLFDWSDIASIPGIVITHGVTEINGKDCFWFRARRDSVNEGTHIILDPTFGNAAGTNTGYIRAFNNNYMHGVWATPNSSGTVDSITVKMANINNNNSYRCALYAYVDYSSDYAGERLGLTEIKALTSADSGTLVTFNFEEGSKPSIVGGTPYYLVLSITTDNGSSKDYIYYQSNAGAGIYQNVYGAYPFDSPMTGELVSIWRLYIYATYTISAEPTEAVNPGDIAADTTQSYGNERYLSVATLGGDVRAKTIDY